MDTGLHPSQHLESDIQPSRNPKSDSGSDDQTLEQLSADQIAPERFNLVGRCSQSGAGAARTLLTPFVQDAAQGNILQVKA